MGKAKNRNNIRGKLGSKSAAAAKPLSSRGVTKRPQKRTAAPPPHSNPPRPTSSTTTTTQSTPTIPFSPNDHILLIGEGDFSFSASLLTSHGCSSLLCTSNDDRETCLAKYPQAETHIRALEAEDDCAVLFGVDATKLGKRGLAAANGGSKLFLQPQQNQERGADEGDRHVSSSDSSVGGRRGGSRRNFDKIVFNFPHVGGLTTDIHRQIRHNQELLLGFFRAASTLLRCPGGQIVLTCFEGEPYHSWDLRGLARQAGLKVERSFRFQASAYPGYQHARTLGNIHGKMGAGGGWKGEDRSARTYLLVVGGEDRGLEGQAQQQDGLSEEKMKKKKRKRHEESDSDSESG